MYDKLVDNNFKFRKHDRFRQYESDIICTRNNFFLLCKLSEIETFFML